MKDFCIVGSGIAGSTIANLLAIKYSVEIFDKARGPGGRASNRRYKKKISFDHGLQYISPKSKEFKKFILNLKKNNILKEWPGKHLDLTFKRKEDSIKYIGLKGNNDISKYLSKNIKLNFNSKVTNIKFNSDYWTVTLNNKEQVFFKYLILTCPFPQLKTLASKHLNKRILKNNINMLPNITVMAANKGFKKLDLSSIKFENKIISWAVQENTKNRFKSDKVLWTIQCTEKFSRKIIDLFKKSKNRYLLFILKTFEGLLGFQRKNIVFKAIHGWKFAYNKSNTKLESFWNGKKNLGVCGDWLYGPYAEDAWLSANSLYEKIKKNPPV